MCGIVGIYHWNREHPVPQETIRRMCRTIVHRGPDNEGWHIDGQVGIGMRRLSIIDLEGGHQPMFSEDGQVVVVFNGEIYNHQELRKELEGLGHRFQTRSDTEVLVHGYEAWHSELPKKLNGMFAFSIWDARRRRLLLARDHVGIKPLYMYRDAEKVAWASEIKALLSVPGIRAELDEAALFDFITFGYVPAPRTLFRGISKVLPATVVSIEQGDLHTDTYWDLSFCPERRPVRSWCEELRTLLDDSVRRRLMSDVPLGAFLSGGVDSSAIVATMRRLGVQKVSTYAIGFGGQDAFHSELDKASRIANTFETDHHEILVEPDVTDLLFPLVEHLDEPFTDTSFLVTYLVSKLARESVAVILSGLGGDELFGGYRRYHGPRLHNLYKWVPNVVHRRIIRPLANRLPVDRGSRWKSMFRYARGFLDQVEQTEASRYQGYVGIFRDGQIESILSPELLERGGEYASNRIAAHYLAAPTSDPINRMLYADFKTSLVDSLLTFTDKMSMAVSLEARVPLLDYRLVELAGRIPPELKLRGFNGMKHIFKEAMRDRLSASVLFQRKQGFGTPISRWFRTSLRPLLHDLLSPKQLAQRGYFKAQPVWKLIDDHMAQRSDNSEHIVALLAFEIWHRIYLD